VNERDIFHAALEISDAALRTVYLEKACAGDISLKQHFEDLLELEPKLGNFLEAPAFARIDAAGPPLLAGRFVLGEELARGGMGIVYRARDDMLGRDVAVKVLHERYLADSLVGRRFLDEAQITAQIQHPGIPPVFEVGLLEDERPYLAMKLIKGRTLEDLLKERPEPASERGRFLAVFQQVCQAVGYAHSKHILHRDLKPGNVMVGAFGEVQVMDWGLAKMLHTEGEVAQEPAARMETIGRTVVQTFRESDSRTVTGSLLGTPAFMAPEQAGGELDRLDERTDVFGLGAILCVILTGRPPYTGKSGEDLRLMAICGMLADAHARLEQCGTDAKLVELCRACLSVEPEGRPRDAGAVAATVASYLAGVEERARQAELERAAAEARAAEQRKRRRVQLALAATVMLALAAGSVATTWQALRATHAEADAVADKTAAFEAKGVALSEADRKRRLLYSADVHLASQAWQSDEGTVSQCKELLLAHVPGPEEPDLREFCWRYQWRLLHRGSLVRLPVVPPATAVAADNRVVTLDETGKVNAWQIDDRAVREELSLAGDGVKGVTLSSNGEIAAVIDRDGSPKVFDIRTGLEKVPIRAPSVLVNLKLSPDGRFLAGVGRDKHARVWDTANGKELYDYLMIDPTAKEIDLSLDGKQLLAARTAEGELVVLYRAGEEKPIMLHKPEGGFNKLAGTLSPDGRIAAVAHAGNAVEFCDTEFGKQLRYRGPDGEWRNSLPSESAPLRVTFSPDGTRVAVGERTGLVTVWPLPPLVLVDQSASAGEPAPIAAGRPRHLKGHEAAIEALAFSADGRKLVSIGHDNTARCWDLGEQGESRVLQKGRRAIDALSYSPDGRYLVEASMKVGIRVHDLRSSDSPRSLTTRSSRRAVFSPDGRTIAGGPDHGVAFWDAKTGSLLATLAEADPAEHDLFNGFSNLGALVFSPDGRWLAAGFGGVFRWPDDASQKVMVFDVAQRKVHRTFATPTQVSAVAFSADGKLLAAAGHNGTVWLWQTSTWDQIGHWQGPADTGYSSILFLSGGQSNEAEQSGDTLATGSRSGRIDLWDVRTGALARQLHGHIALVSFMALSPDGRTLATASCDRSIKLWDTGTGRELRLLCREAGWMHAVAFSPDGNSLASGGQASVLRLWEAPSKETVDAELAEQDLQAKTSWQGVGRGFRAALLPSHGTPRNP
jgi:WD40 repeat protein/tRNA A-37 threonylcarbamoyl transferase component Bud32